MLLPPVQFLGITICLLIFGASGASSASIAHAPLVLKSAPMIPVTTPTPIFGCILCIRITNLVFTDALRDQNSEDYKNLRNEVAQLMNNVFNCSNCDTKDTYGGIVEMTFKKGSVIANSTLMFRTVQINAVVIKYLFSSGVEDSPHPHLQLDMDYTMDKVTPVPIPLPEKPIATTPMTTTKTPLSKTTTHLIHPQMTSSNLNTSPNDLTKATTNDDSKTETPLHITTEGAVISTESPFGNTSDSMSSITSPPLSHTTEKKDMSTNTPSINTGDSIQSTSNPSLSYTTDGVDRSTNVPLRNSSDSNSTTSPQLSYTSHHPSTPLGHTTAHSIDKTTVASGNASHSGTAIPPNNTSGPHNTETTNHSEGKVSSRPTHHTNSHSSGTTHGTPETEHAKVHTTTAAAAGGSGGVPGWGIAILVLAALVLLLLIIILILLVMRWCCRKKQTGSMNVPSDTSPYEEPNPKTDLPAYSPPEDSKSPKSNFQESFEKPKKNRSGKYVVNH